MRTKEIILQGNNQEQGNYSPISLQSLESYRMDPPWGHPKLDEAHDWENPAQIQQGQGLFDKHGFLL